MAVEKPIVLKSDGEYEKLQDADWMPGADVHFFRAVGTTTNRWYLGNIILGTTTTSSIGTGTIRFMPIMIPKKTTIGSLRVNITSGGGNGFTFRLGIYAADNAYPGTLLYDSGTISATANAAYTATPNLAVEPGLYWFCVSTSGTMTFTAVGQGTLINPLGWDGTTFVAQTVIYYTRNYAAYQANLIGANFPTWNYTATVTAAIWAQFI